MWRRLSLLTMLLILGSTGTDRLFANLVYWTDKNDATIRRGDMDGSGPSQILLDWSNGLIEPRGLGLDIAAGKMYWADAGTYIGNGGIRRITASNATSAASR